MVPTKNRGTKNFYAKKPIQNNTSPINGWSNKYLNDYFQVFEWFPVIDNINDLYCDGDTMQKDGKENINHINTQQ